jgi:hypothetical protein
LRDHHPWSPDSGLSYHPSTGYAKVDSSIFFSSLAWSPRKLAIHLTKTKLTIYTLTQVNWR